MIKGIVGRHASKQFWALARRCHSSNRPDHSAMERKKRLYYPLLPDLPGKIRSPEGDIFFTDIPNDSQLVEAYALFQATVNKDDGFGVDDYPTLDYFIDYMCHDSIVPFVMYQKPEKKILGFFSTCPSRFCRGVNPVFCGGTTVFHDSMKDHGVYNQMADLYWEYAQHLGYEGYLGETFVNNKKVIHTLTEHQNFKILGELPKISRLKHSGWVNSLAIVKLLREGKDEKPGYSVSKVIVPDPNISQITLNNHARKIDNLPRQCITHNGAQLSIDYVMEEDIEPIYDMFVKAQNEGDGFAIDEYPTFNHFVYKLRRGHIFSIKVKGNIVGAMAVIPSRFVRSLYPILGDGPVIVDVQYRGNGNLIKLMRFHDSISKELGYVGSLRDTFATNYGHSTLSETGERGSDRKSDSEVVARIPRTGYVAGKGWTDSYITYKDFSDF
ncbi:unnamed protein product, partial [Owenia fusiformis]